MTGAVMVVRNRPVVAGVTPRGCFWWCFVAYGVLGALFLIAYTIRWWSRFDRPLRLIFGACVAFAVLCFGAIAVVWLRTRA